MSYTVCCLRCFTQPTVTSAGICKLLCNPPPLQFLFSLLFLNQICCDYACSVLCWGFCCFSPLFPLSMSEHEMGCRFPSRAKCGNNNLILTETGLCLSHALLVERHGYSVGEVLTLALLPGIVEDDCMPLCVTANLSVCILAETGLLLAG